MTNRKLQHGGLMRIHRDIAFWRTVHKAWWQWGYNLVISTELCKGWSVLLRLRWIRWFGDRGVWHWKNWLAVAYCYGLPTGSTNSSSFDSTIGNDPQYWSLGRGRVMERLVESADWAWWKKASRLSDQLILSWDWRPATTVSCGDSRAEHWGITLVRTFYAPEKDFRRPTVSGLLQDARVAIRCGEA